MLRTLSRRFSTAAASSLEHAKPFEQMPGPKRWPFIGSLPAMIQELDPKKGGFSHLIQQWYNRYGSVFRTRLVGGGDNVYLANPQDVREVYMAEGKYPSGAVGSNWPLVEFNKMYPTSSPTVAGLLTTGPEWRQSRTILNNHIFTPSDANQYLPSLHEEIDLVSQAVKKHPEFHVHQFMRLVVFDLFCSGIAGHSWHITDHSSEKIEKVALDFVNVTAQNFELLGALLFTPLSPKFVKYTKSWKDFVHTRKESMRLSRVLVEHAAKSSKNSYLAKQLRDGVSIEDAGEVLAGLLGAAIDTTSVALAKFLYVLAANPQVQERLANELKQELNGANYNEEAKVPYLRACWRESQRLHPVGAVTSLRVLTKDTVLSGHLVPKGTNVNFMTNTFENDPNLLGTDGNVYRPERWLQEEVAARKGTAQELLDHRMLGYHGMFSFGPRMCLGARFAVNEIMVTVSRLIQDYELSVITPHEGLDQRLLLFLKPDPKLRAVPRSSSVSA